MNNRIKFFGKTKTWRIVDYLRDDEEDLKDNDLKINIHPTRNGMIPDPAMRVGEYWIRFNTNKKGSQQIEVYVFDDGTVVYRKKRSPDYDRYHYLPLPNLYKGWDSLVYHYYKGYLNKHWKIIVKCYIDKKYIEEFRWKLKLDMFKLKKECGIYKTTK